MFVTHLLTYSEITNFFDTWNCNKENNAKKGPEVESAWKYVEVLEETNNERDLI